MYSIQSSLVSKPPVTWYRLIANSPNQPRRLEWVVEPTFPILPHPSLSVSPAQPCPAGRYQINTCMHRQGRSLSFLSCPSSVNDFSLSQRERMNNCNSIQFVKCRVKSSSDVCCVCALRFHLYGLERLRLIFLWQRTVFKSGSNKLIFCLRFSTRL